MEESFAAESFDDKLAEQYLCYQEVTEDGEGHTMIRKLPVEEGKVQVLFELYTSPWSERVSVVGEFNHWDTSATPMHRNETDLRWAATVVLAAGQRYRFRYLRDGQEWINDWHADDHVENSYGSYDSVVDLAK